MNAPAVFDAHAHLVSNDPSRYPYSPLSGVVDASALEDPVTAERLIELMRTTGVDRAVAVQRAHVYGTDNRYVVDAASNFPAGFSALVLVNPLAEDGTAAVHHWVGRRRAIGVRLTAPSSDCGLAWLSSQEALSVWNAVADAGASMRVHFYSWNRAAGLQELRHLARRYPGTPIVLDHLSNVGARNEGPEFGLDEELKAISEHDNVSIMFSTINSLKSAAAGCDLAPLLTRIIQTFGAERVMWGSDVGQSRSSYPQMVAMARQAVAGLPDAAQREVLWGAANRVYGNRR